MILSFQMVDVPYDDDEDSYDGPLIDEVEENANMFDRRYFENKENPLYTSDPDLSQLVEHPVSRARTIPVSKQTVKCLLFKSHSSCVFQLNAYSSLMDCVVVPFNIECMIFINCIHQ